MQGIKKGAVPQREEWCVQRVEDALGFAAGRFFVQAAFGGDSKAKGTKVIRGMWSVSVDSSGVNNDGLYILDIIDTFKESLKNLKWMDDKSAKAASEKVCIDSLSQDLHHFSSTSG